MKAAFYQDFGSVDQLNVGERPTPTPADNELCIKVIASSVNPIDWKLRQGLLKFQTKKKLPFIPGSDISGVVSSVGDKVRGFTVGDEVFGQISAINGGALAEYCVATEDCVVKKEEGFSHEEASGVSLAGQTSYQALVEQAGLKASQTVLIIGASGGIGQMGVQIAKAIDAKVIAVCSQKNAELVRSLGADQVIDYQQTDFRKEQLTVDVIYDCVGNDTPSSCRSILAKKGVFLSPAPQLKQIPELLYYRYVSPLLGGVKAQIVLLKKSQDKLQALDKLIKEQKLKVTVDKVFSLDEVKEAHRYSESGRARGKIIVTL